VYEQTIFRTQIWGCVLTSEEIRLSTYLQAVQQLATTDGGVRKSNFGGWQSHDKIHEMPVFKPLVRAILDFAAPILQPYTPQTPIIQSMWANLNFKHCYNGHHTHEGWLSGVFYLQVPPKSGRLIFTNPAIRSERHLLRDSNYPLTPVKLGCILFPSWLEHYVEPSQSDQPRISISFNIGDK
jgi:uncharacterized protein (TIGR02466 family)